MVQHIRYSDKKDQEAFWFNSMATSETINLLDIQTLADLFNEQIDLSKYGTGLHRIYFTFQAIDPNTYQLENEINFDPELNYLHISLPLSYQHLLNASSETIREMIARLFLVAINLYDEAGVTNFDQNGFKNEVARILEKEKWLPIEVEEK